MPTPIIARVPPESRHRLATPLSAGQSAALVSMMNGGLLRPIIDDATAAPLVATGYARQTAGGLALTDQGQVRAMMENGQ